ncbi:translation initiation factor IF-2-like [Apodemus sylvaticus]|uniref:translation initiation factor IF-2-like n=1 Tax=Apodemus sylvaticus TaxID=10129 RepID=UPI0022428F09|nr:translation initiation factor IF-2-like [Apodemus sylvaticus]
MLRGATTGVRRDGQREARKAGVARAAGGVARGRGAGPAALIFGGISVLGVSNLPWACPRLYGRGLRRPAQIQLFSFFIFLAGISGCGRGYSTRAWPAWGVVSRPVGVAARHCARSTEIFFQSGGDSPGGRGPAPAPPRSRARQSLAMARVCIAVLALLLLLGASPRGGGETGVAGGSRGHGKRVGGLSGVALAAGAIPRPQLRRERTLVQSRSFPCRSPSRSSRKEPEGQPLPCCRSAAGDAQSRSTPCRSSAAAASGPLPGRRPLFSPAAGRAGPRAGRGRGNPRGEARACSGGDGVRPGDAPGAAAGEWPGWRAADNDFRLEDGLPDADKKPTPKAPTPKRPSADLDLSDALPDGGVGDDGGSEKPGRPRKPPTPDVKPPRTQGDSGSFGDRDLEDVAGKGGAETEGAPQGLVPGVVAAVVAAVAGAVSSFVAYQKKKLCFREGGGSAPV